MSKLTFEQWEEKIGIISDHFDPKTKDNKLTEDEFRELAMPTNDSFRGVMHEDRIKFLKDNGYELTRENMCNPDLSAKPKNHESE